ncbi:MAG: hypothetical protein QM763_03140 [Agriterribacter sp.]
MVVKQGESKQEVLRSGTYRSITVIPYLVAAANNDRLTASDLDASQVNVKVILKRNKATYLIMNDNLKLLAFANTLKKGFQEFYNGLDIVFPAASVKHVSIRPVTLDFGTNIRLNAGDELVAEVKVATTGAFFTDVNATDSYAEFYFNPSVGYEAGVPEVVCEVVQANATKQSFSLGSGVTDVSFINFDKDDLVSQVITTLQLSSDKLDLGLSFNQLQARRTQLLGEQANVRYGSSLPVTVANQAIFRALDFFPQSMPIVCGEELDTAKLDISFNGANVVASQNYVVYRRVSTSNYLKRFNAYNNNRFSFYCYYKRY